MEKIRILPEQVDEAIAHENRIKVFVKYNHFHKEQHPDMPTTRSMQKVSIAKQKRSITSARWDRR